MTLVVLSLVGGPARGTALPLAAAGVKAARFAPAAQFSMTRQPVASTAAEHSLLHHGAAVSDTCLVDSLVSDAELAIGGLLGARTGKPLSFSG